MASNFLATLEQRKPEIQKMLAEWITPERFFAMAMQMTRNPKIAECSADSLVNCVMQAAQAGLELGEQRGHVYVIPYDRIAQLQIGWRGLVFLKLRAGAIISLDTDVVFESDVFEVTRSSEADSFKHVPNYKDDRSEKAAYAAYARAKLPAGETQYEVLGKDRIGRHRKHSKQPNSLMWTTFWEEGWRKCPVRVLDKRLPEGVNSEAIERYHRALEIESHNWKAGAEEAIQVVSVANDLDNPVPDDAPRRVEPEVIRDAPIGDSSNDYRDILALSKAAKLSMRELCDLLEGNLGIDSPELIRQSQVSTVTKLIADLRK